MNTDNTPAITSKTTIQCQQLTRSFIDMNGQSIDILKGINLTIQAGEMIAVLGASGSGKTTLLQILGGLDKATTGRVLIDGCDPSTINDKTLSQLRNKKLGFVYQFHHLIAEISALENVSMPLFIAGVNRSEAFDRGAKVLADLGLSARSSHQPAKLSGGERQRVAIGRAIINHPLCLLADEPTGNLDRKNAEKIIDLIAQLNQSHHMSVLLNTHDSQLAKRMHHTFSLQGGHLQPESL